MFAKLNNPGFLAGTRPLLMAAQAEGLTHETMMTAFSKEIDDSAADHKVLLDLPQLYPRDDVSPPAYWQCQR